MVAGSGNDDSVGILSWLSFLSILHDIPYMTLPLEKDVRQSSPCYEPSTPDCPCPESTLKHLDIADPRAIYGSNEPVRLPLPPARALFSVFCHFFRFSYSIRNILDLILGIFRRFAILHGCASAAMIAQLKA